MMEYKRLGDYIREVNVRNRDEKVTNLVGLTIDKAFIPSVANVIGTDLSNYKIISSEQFACSLMQVSRDGKMPVAMFEEDEAIMSPAYPMFEIVDKTELLPKYLMMWFSRSEFDREASYYAVGGVRGSLTWEDFCNMTLPVPSIERQREIVEEYETLYRRISLNEQMIQKLEATAQALYRKMFIDGIDKENLPEGWRMGTLGDIYKFQYGKGNNNPDNGGQYPVYGGGKSIIGWYNEYNSEDAPVIGHIGNCGSLVFAFGKHFVTYNGVICNILNNKWKFFGYLTLSSCDLESQSRGSTQPFLSYDMLYEIEIAMPPMEKIKLFDELVSSIFNYIYFCQQENSKLKELQSLLLAKMGNLKQ